MRVVLIGWKDADVQARATELRAGGLDVEAFVPIGGATPLFRSLRESPPDAVIIDLDRLPSHGKAVGVAMRDSKSLRGIPLVYAGGVKEKVAGIRELPPDAVYVPWAQVGKGVQKAATAAPPAPLDAKAPSKSATVPVLRKLAIKSGMTVLLLNAPAAFFRAVGELPESASWIEDAAAPHDMEIRFVEEMEELLGRFRQRVDKPLWIAWPKQTARSSELKQQTIRELAATFGLVDYKICAIDETWSGMLFSRRRSRAKP